MGRMTDPQRTARIAKIRHILALTSSDQPGEAQAAAAMAAKLKRLWGIEDAELVESDAPPLRSHDHIWTVEELREQLLDQTPFVAGRSISPNSVRRAGWTSWRYPLGLQPWQSMADIANSQLEGAPVIYLEAQFTALECLIVPRLIRMYPSWTDGQLSAAAAETLDDMFADATAQTFPWTSNIGAFREYLVTHPLPATWPQNAAGSLPGRRGAPRPDLDTPRNAAIWAALLTVVGGVDDTLIDAFLTEWEEGDQATQATRKAPRRERGPRPPPAWGGPPNHPVGADPSSGKSGASRPRRRVRMAVFALLAALVTIAVLYQLQDDTTEPEAAAAAGERAPDDAPPPPDPSADEDPPGLDPAAVPSEDESTSLDPPDAGAMAPPEIVAVCNTWLDLNRQWQHSTSAHDCRTAGAAGLRVGSGWGLAVLRESREGANVEYRFSDGSVVRPGGATERNVFAALAPGRHTIEVREQRDGIWSGWSAPYTFTTVQEVEIDAICNAYWDPDMNQWQQPATPADCRASAADGLRTGSGWDWQTHMRGGVEPANVSYRFDGGAGFSDSADGFAAFAALAPGRHTVEAREQRPWGWTDWSTPYEFEIIAVLEVIGICSYPSASSSSYTTCKAAESQGFDVSMTWWFILADGVLDWENVVYRFDGGEATSEEDIVDLWSLLPGPHTVEIRERRSWGWTDWSPPYGFTVR
jgi:hypothetical protein